MQEVPEETGLTPAPVTEAELAELDELIEKATPGTWTVKTKDGRRNIGIESSDVVQMDRPDMLVSSVHITAWKQDRRNAIPTAELIAESHNILPRLIAHIRTLSAENARLWKQHMTLISHDNAELKVLRQHQEIERLSAENAQLLRVLAGWKQEAHESVEIIHRLEAENAGLRAALEPFADAADQINSREPEFTVGDLRRAAAAYSTTPGAGDKKWNEE